MTDRQDDTRPTRRLEGVQIGRAVAALSVLVSHVLHKETLDYARAAESIFPWYFGVDLFFVISGFMMVTSSDRLFGSPGAWKYFALRRVERIVPLYWLFVSLAVVALFVAPQEMSHPDIDWVQIAYSYLFYPGFVRSDGHISPVLALGWTINYEVFFYAVFCLLLRFRQVTAVGVLTAVFGVLALANSVVPKSWSAVQFWTNPIILEFVLGALLGLAFSHGARIGAVAAGGLVMAGLVGASWAANGVDAATQLGQAWSRPLGLGLPALLIVAALVLWRPLNKSSPWTTWLVKLGDSSYSLYLSHPFTITLVWMVADKVLGPASSGSVAWLSALAAIGVGELCYRMVERRLRRIPAPTLRAESPRYDRA
jgi:exopolysaccharide production protein ExoZ